MGSYHVLGSVLSIHSDLLSSSASYEIDTISTPLLQMQNQTTKTP